MHLNFRQGLISFQQTGSQPAFLLESSVTGYVDLNVSPVPLICTMAHGTTDYLFQFDASIVAAFGPLMASVDNYLYIELNLITGALTQGVSQLEPIVSAVEPLNPVAKLMWFDLASSVMKVRSNDNLKWIVQPRLVLGKVRNISQILMNPMGSTVGLNTHSHPGFLMLDSQLRPLRTSLGELLTTDSGVRVKTTVGTSGVLTLPTNGFIPARAAEPIPAMSLVYFSGADTISLASSNPSLTVSKAPVAIVQLPLSQNEVGGITQAGEITSDQWDWTGNIGKPLYCGATGELTITRPQGAQVYRVGYIKNARTILFYIDAESTIQITSAPPAIVSANAPLSSSVGLNLNGETVTSISLSTGNLGEVLTSAGPGVPATWAPLPAPPEVPVVPPSTQGTEPHIFELTGTEAFGTELSVWPSVQQPYAPAAQLINYDTGMANIYFETPGVYRIKLSCAASCVPGDYGTPTSWPYEMTAFGTRLVGTNMTVIGSDKSVHTRGGDFKLDHNLETVHTRAYWDSTITSLGLLAQTNTWVDEYIVLAYTVDAAFPTNGSNFDIVAFTDVGPRPIGFPPHPNVDFKVVLTVEKISANVPPPPL